MIQKTKQKISGLFLVAVIVLSALIFPVGKIFSNYANAATQESISLSNGNFNINNDTSYLDTNPTGWSKILSTPGTYGIINTAETKFNKSTYRLPENPQTLVANAKDTKVLMLNARREENDSNQSAQGYKSNSITLNAKSYYQISILAKTEHGEYGSSFGSIYIKGLTNTNNPDNDITKSSQFEKIQTSGNWSEYIFFIETADESKTATVELWLGTQLSSNARSPYAIFYDNVKVTRYSQTSFKKQLNIYSTTKNTNLISLEKTYLESVKNADFEIANIKSEDGESNRYWTPISAFPDNSVHKIVDATQALTARNDDNSVQNYTFLNSNNLDGKNALWLAANNAPSSEFGYKSTNLPINMFEYYKINITAKVDKNTTAKIVLQENNDISDFLIAAGIDEKHISYTPKSQTFTITSNPSQPLMNDYGTYSFYVKASTLYSTSVHLQLLLSHNSAADTTFSGSVLFDDITVEQSSSKAYENATTSSYVNKLNLEVTSEESLSVANGNFNLISTNLDGLSFPANPKNWTIEQNDTLKSKAGIVNILTSHFEENRESYGNPQNPKNPNDETISTDIQANNVLMLWNGQSTYQSVTTDTISVSSNTIYTLKFKFKTTPPTSNFNISILNQDDVKVFKTSKVTSVATETNMWLDFKIHIRTGSSTTGIKLAFGLGDETLKSVGHVFIDNVSMTTSEITEAILLEKLANQSPREKTIDMSNLLLNSPYLDENNNLIITAFNQNNLSNSIHPNAFAGVIKGTANDMEIANSEENTSNNKHIYYIETTGKSNYELSSKEQLNLTSQTVYKFSIWINTKLRPVQDDTIKYGASFGLSNIADAKLENINTNNEWKEFVIIVNTTTTSNVSLKLSLLSQNIDTDGITFFENFQMTTLNQDEYQEYVADYNENEINPNLLIVGSTDPISEEEEEKQTAPKQSFNYLVLPSMLTAVALVLAVTAAILKRVNFKKLTRKQKTEYDRKKTLYKDVIRKEAQTQRDKNIEEVNKQIAQLDKQIEDLETANKERIEFSRKTRGRQVDTKTEREFKLYAKQRTRLERQKIVLVEKVKKYNTAEYLLELQEEITKNQLKNLKK